MAVVLYLISIILIVAFIEKLVDILGKGLIEGMHHPTAWYSLPPALTVSANTSQGSLPPPFSHNLMC
jgi:hypothetical protein